MADAAHSPSRRGILGALAMTPAMVAIPSWATTPGGSREWDASLHALEAATRSYEDAETRLNNAQESYYSNKPPQPRGGLVLRSKGRSYSMEEAVSNMKAEQAAWVAEDRAVRRRYGFDEAAAACREALNAETTALAALISVPVSDPHAVAKKIELAIKYNCEIDEIEPLIADLRRMGAN